MSDEGAAVAVVEESKTGIQLLIDLEAAGACDEVSLTLTDPDMPYQQWEDLGRFLGSIDKRARWYIGDWLNFGEAIFGEEAAQGIESTTSERYAEAERVTGLDHGTLMNVRSVCASIPKENRRRELGFWIHQEVAKLDVADQPGWLQKAIDEGWTKMELRAAIKEAKSQPADPPADDAGEPGPSVSEQIENAARLVWHQCQANSDGDFVVPASVMSQLAAALGEEG